MRDKIIPIDRINEVLRALKKQGKRIVHSHGVFDLIHAGHIRHLESARQMGDILVVSITADAYVNKGPGRPVFDERTRAEVLAALQMVDFVTINHNVMAISAIEAIAPDLYVKGQEYQHAPDDFTGGITIEKNAVESVGGKLAFTFEPQYSSSNLINRFMHGLDKNTEEYLEGIRKTIQFDKIKQRFEDISKYHVLVAGDVIIDEYQFIRPVGKASKSASITSLKLKSELYAGGVLAVANHIADFVSKVTLVTTSGINGETDYLPFIRKQLHPNVELICISMPDRPTTLKRRFVDDVFGQKLFEVCEIDDREPPAGVSKQIIDAIDQHGACDMTMVADFGHGFMHEDLMIKLSNLKTFLCLNAQTNSTNKGFNLLTKYPRCDYFSIDKEEARLAMHSRFGNIEDIQSELMRLTQATISSITLGVNGTLVRRVGEAPVNAPILNSDVVDTIGAGDAYLSITGLLARQGAPAHEIAFIGNAVGAMAVKILGNKSYIEKTPLLKYIKALLA
jgi:rfaE bifunctional protein nucleotidyltransferase chain/domain